MKKLDPVVKYLRAMRRLLSKPEKWTQRAGARTKTGEVVYSQERDAYSFCLLGALNRVSLNEELGWFYNDAEQVIKRNLPKERNVFANMTVFNDNPKTTHRKILSLLDECIADAESSAKTKGKS